MTAPADERTGYGPWNWHPPLPLEGAPVLVFPPRPLKALRWLLSVGFLWSFLAPYTATALLTWFLLQPPLADCAVLAPGWILVVLGRNMALMLVIAGGLHLYLHRWRRQGSTHRYETRELGRDDPRFLCRDQVIDNMAWSMGSGVVLWSAIEVLFLHAYANGALPALAWSAHPFWFAALFLAIPFWQSAHFFVIHRLLHWRPLYRLVHAVHHRNVAIGPWSGISMHPIEHLLYFSSVAIHLVVPSSPLHVIFHMQFLVFGAVQSHCGFADLVVRGRATLALGDFFHQLHHRYFHCNYGADYVQLDRWSGSFHDGTAEATRRIARQGHSSSG